MVQCVQYGAAIGTFNMHTQVECEFIDEMTPFLTNMGKPAPQKSTIPMALIIQSIAVEYAEEYIIVEPMDSTERYVVSLLGCWQW